MAVRATSSSVPGGIGGNRLARKAAAVAVGGTLFFAMAFPAVAEAQTFVSGSAEVQNNQVTPQGGAPEAQTEVLGVQAERGLAATGAEVVGIAIAGAAAVGVGGVLLAARRRDNRPAR